MTIQLNPYIGIFLQKFHITKKQSYGKDYEKSTAAAICHHKKKHIFPI